MESVVATVTTYPKKSAFKLGFASRGSSINPPRALKNIVIPKPVVMFSLDVRFAMYVLIAVSKNGYRGICQISNVSKPPDLTNPQ